MTAGQESELSMGTPWAWPVGLLVVTTALAFHLAPDGIARSYDWGLQVAWIERFYLQLSAGTAWPQWLHEVDSRRGQPVFVFYPPLAYWLASALRALSGDAVSALKLAEFFSIGLLYCSCYALFRRSCRPVVAAGLAVAASLSPAVLFLGLRTHMLGATLALAAFPWIVSALLAQERSWRWRTATLALAIGFIGWCHLLSLVMGCVLAIALCLLLIWSKQQKPTALLAAVAGGLLLGIGLGLAATWPALTETTTISIDYLSGGNLDWRSNFLLDPSSDLTGFRRDYVYLGLAALAILFWAALSLRSAKPVEGPIDQNGKTLALIATGCVLLATPIAWPLYATVPPLALFQFPWRWLPIASILALAAIAYRLNTCPDPWKWISAVLAVSAFGWWSIASGSGPLPDRPRTTAEEQRRVIHDAPRSTPEYRPRTLIIEPSAMTSFAGRSIATSSSERIAISPAGASSADTRWRITATEPGYVNLGIACFPGWVATLDDVAIELGCDERGLITVPIVVGNLRLELRFEATPSRTAARAVSGLAALLWLGLIAGDWLRRRQIGAKNQAAQAGA